MIIKDSLESPIAKGQRPKTRSAWIAILWALAIFGSSCFFISADAFIGFMQRLLPNPSLQMAFARFWYHDGFFVVKAWHATEYTILMSLLYLWLRRYMPPARALFLALLVSIGYAATDEWHQTFVPKRDGCLRDVIIDSAGASLMAAFCAIKLKRTNKAATPSIAPDSLSA